MGLVGNLIKGVVNKAVAPIVIVTDVVKGDFDNTGNIIENVVDTVEDSIEDIINGDLI